MIKNLGGNDAVPAIEENKYAMEQAKALRAYAYFYLTQFYQKEYNASEAILPLYLEPISVNVPKATAEEVYALMEKDLTEAISLLNGFNRVAKNQVNQDIAKGLLSYILGAKGGRDLEVAALTQEVINAGNFSILAPSELIAATGGVNGFDDVNSNSWMWGIDITNTNGLGHV